MEHTIPATKHGQWESQRNSSRRSFSIQIIVANLFTYTATKNSYKFQIHAIIGVAIEWVDEKKI